jgi:hypothetical protein
MIVLKRVKMTNNDIYTETIYSGSKECRSCGNIMGPYEAMQVHKGICGNCRSSKMEQLVRQGMSEK